MNEQIVRFLIEARDKASAVIQDVSKNIDTMSDKTKTMSKSLSTRATDNEKTFRNMRNYGAIAFTAISAFAYKWLKAYQEVERASRQLENAIIWVSKGTKEQVEQVKAVTLALEKKAGIDAEALNMWVAQLSTFGLQSKSVIDLTKSLADLTLNQNGVNASADQYISSANIMAKAMRGEFWMLQKMGIRFTETQQNMINFGTESEKVAALQAWLAQNLRETTDTIGGLDVSMAKFQRNVESVGDAVWKALAPALNAILEKLTPLIWKFAERAEANSELLWKIILVAWWLAAVVTVVWLLWLALPAIITWFTLLMWPVGLVIAWIAGVTAAILYLQQVVWPYKEQSMALTQAMADLDTQYKNGEISQAAYALWMQTLWGQMEALKGNTSEFVQWRVDTEVAIQWWEERVMTSITNFFTTVWQMFTTRWTAIYNTTFTTFTKIRDFTINSILYIANFFRWAATMVSDAFSAMFSGIAGVAKSVFNGVIWIIEWFVNLTIRMLNKLISAANVIPGVRIPMIAEFSIQRLAHGGLVKWFGIDKAMKKFAIGGVVTGPWGIDKVPAMLTAGELVLNAAQQRNLAGNLEGGKGQTIQINIYGNEFNGSWEDFAEKIGDQIMSRFKIMAQFQSF